MTTFCEWFTVQAANDYGLPPHQQQAFSGLYVYGEYFNVSLGKGSPDPAAFKAHMSLQEPEPSVAEQAELLRQLIIADATWRTDEFSDNPEPESAATGTEELVSPIPSISPAVIKSMPCGFRDLDGLRCTSAAVDGAARCVAHGGAITDPGVRGSLLLLAYAQLVQGSKKAVDTLLDVMEHSGNDLAKVQAAKELLDRAGLTIDQHITVTASDEATDTKDAMLERIKRHLDTTKSRLLPPPAPDDDEIVDAELVEAEVVES